MISINALCNLAVQSKLPTWADTSLFHWPSMSKSAVKHAHDTQKGGEVVVLCIKIKFAFILALVLNKTGCALLTTGVLFWKSLWIKKNWGIPDQWRNRFNNPLFPLLHITKRWIFVSVASQLIGY